MANRAAQIRAQLEAQYPGSIVVDRSEGSITLQHPNGQRTVVASKWLHYQNGLLFAEIETDFTDSSDPNYDDRTEGLPYHVSQRGGDRRIYPRKHVLTEYIELGRPEFQQLNGTWNVIPFTSKVRDGNKITFKRADSELEIIATPSRLKMNLRLLTAPARNVWRFPITLVGLTRDGRNVISNSDGAIVSRIEPFTLTDSAGTFREIPGTLTNHPTYQGAYQISPSLTGLVYPVTIDPTIAVDIGVGSDDGHLGGFGQFHTTITDLAFGEFWGPNNTFMRFLVPAGPVAGSTVTAARIDAVAFATIATTGTNVLIRADDQNSPTAPATSAIMSARTRTTANAAWTNIPAWTAGQAVSTPSLVTIIQELWNSGFGLAGEYIQIFIENNGSTSGSMRQIASLEHATYAPPQLVITYSTPGGTIDETTTTASTLHSFEGKSVEGLVIAQTGSPQVAYVRTAGTDGFQIPETGNAQVAYVKTTGTNTGTLTDLLSTASVVYARSTSSVLALNMAAQGPEGVITAFTGGSDVGVQNEFEDSVEAIVEALSSIETHLMYDTLTVEQVLVYAGGFDILGNELDNSNPITIYVETSGTDGFDLGPQVYDEVDGEISVLYPLLSGDDTQVIYDLLELFVIDAVTEGTVEYFDIRYNEFDNPVDIVVVTEGTHTMVFNASIGDVHTIPAVTGGTALALHMSEPTGLTVIGSVESSSVETYAYNETGGISLIGVATSGTELIGFIDLIGLVFIRVRTIGDVAMTMSETSGETIIDVVVSGYEGNYFEDYANHVIVPVVTGSSIEERLIRVPSRYLRSALVSIEPYEASTLQVVSPYFRSSLVSLKPMRESVLAAI